MSRVVVGVIEPYDSAHHHLTESDICYIESFSSAKRRAEVASWRDLLRRTISTSNDILYHPSGAPYIVDSSSFISVSHSSTHVAVMISDAPCAIDLESLSRNFARVASRYVTPLEAELNAESTPLLPLLWSAKEVLYKLSPLDGLDLLADLRVNSISGDLLRCSVTGCDGEVTLRSELRNGHILVYNT